MMHPHDSEAAGLYIHIPFCAVRCRYCDFYSQVGADHLSPAYLAAVAQDILSFPARSGYKPTVASIFLGGGTPSTAEPKAISRLLDACRQAFPVSASCEVTLEANPESLTEEALRTYETCGINRLSIGVQSLRDEHLRMMGRPHDAAQAIEALSMARRSGIDTISADFIYGLPGQSARAWREDLAIIAGLGLEHISAYILETDKDTPLAREMASGSLPEPEAEEVAAQWEETCEILEAEGYQRYEISNFARPGRWCLHNLGYWSDRPYLGFGSSAHGYWAGQRTVVRMSAAEYIAAVENRKETMEVVEPYVAGRRLAEAVVTGLRLAEGCDFAALSLRYGVDLFAMHAAALADEITAGRLATDGVKVRLTPAGILYSNDVLCRFI